MLVVVVLVFIYTSMYLGVYFYTWLEYTDVLFLSL